MVKPLNFYPALSDKELPKEIKQTFYQDRTNYIDHQKRYTDSINASN